MSLWQPSYKNLVRTPVFKFLLSMWMRSYYSCKHRQSSDGLSWTGYCLHLYYIPLLSETSLTIIYILEVFCQRQRNSATRFESGTDIARVRPWKEREGPRQGVQTAEAQFKVAASVRHVRRQIWNNIRPVESYMWFHRHIQPLYVIVELLMWTGGLSLTVTTGRHGQVGYCPASYSRGPRLKFRTGHRLFWVFSVFLSPSD
jgi:hypothetical protein